MARASEDWLAVLEQLEKGDALAFARVTDVVYGHLARLRAFEHREAWGDLVQDVVIALLRAHRKKQLREARSFISYVGTVTRNKLLDWLQRQGRPGSATYEGDAGLEAESRTDLKRSVSEQNTDTLIDLDRALLSLPDKERQVMEKIYLEGFSYKEAAEILGMPLGTLNRLQNQGLKKLREEMGVP